jgi:hypothetical protein
MVLPERLRIVAPGSFLLLVSGLAGVWIGFPTVFTDPPGLKVFLAGAAIFVFAPVFLVVSWVGGGSVPGYVVVLGLGAIAAVPFHPLVKLRWAAIVTIAGLVAWMLCQAFVVVGARIV